ncbi:MAG: FAD:protein FMN transferase [Fimbriimonadaceae bacterium]
MLDELTRFSFTEYHMGIDARIVVYATNREKAEEACIAAFARIAELDEIMSDYRRDSELNNLCAQAGGPPAEVSSDLFKVLTKAQDVSARSKGAFDVTAGPLIRLWRSARKTRTLPSPEAIKSARKLIGYQKMKLSPRDRMVQLKLKGMQLDLGGIAKGYACDEAQKVLKKHGISHALVEMGGDLVVSAPPPGAKGWTVRVPNAGTDKGPADLLFSNCAVSTSGDTEQYAVIGGVQYSHVVDPRTGKALTNRIQATIVAPNGLTSDPLSTTLTVLGPISRARFLKSYPGLKCYIKSLKPK